MTRNRRRLHSEQVLLLQYGGVDRMLTSAGRPPVAFRDRSQRPAGLSTYELRSHLSPCDAIARPVMFLRDAH